MQSKVQILERVIAFVGSIVSILGFSGITAYAIFKNFDKYAPVLGEKLLYSVGALFISSIAMLLSIGFLRMFAQIVLGGIKITNIDGETDEFRTAQFHSFKVLTYLSLSGLIAIVVFIGLILMIW